MAMQDPAASPATMDSGLNEIDILSLLDSWDAAEPSGAKMIKLSASLSKSQRLRLNKPTGDNSALSWMLGSSADTAEDLREMGLHGMRGGPAVDSAELDTVLTELCMDTEAISSLMHTMDTLSGQMHATVVNVCAGGSAELNSPESARAPSEKAPAVNALVPLGLPHSFNNLSCADTLAKNTAEGGGESGCLQFALTSGADSAPSIDELRSHFCKQFASEVDVQVKKVHKRRRLNLPQEATDILTNFVQTHIDNPYATPEKKEQLALECGINVEQVSNWLTNYRKRHWQPPSVVQVIIPQENAKQHVAHAGMG